MSHAPHTKLKGYDARQLLHDGCSECEHRGLLMDVALEHMSPGNFSRAWARAYNLHASAGDRSSLGPISVAERGVLDTLWGIQLKLAALGYELTPDPLKLGGLIVVGDGPDAA